MPTLCANGISQEWRSCQWHASMPAVRMYTRSRLCRKYRPYVLIAVIILTFQLILAYSIYKISTFEDYTFIEWKKEGHAGISKVNWVLLFSEMSVVGGCL